MKKNNKTFSRLNKSEKRVAIAKDVILQLKLGKTRANQGAYVTDIKLKDGQLVNHYSENLDDDVQKNFDKIKTCKVCGIGACMVSIAKLNDKLTFDDLLTEDNKATVDSLEEFFSSKQLYLIETAFERGKVVGGYVKSCISDNVRYHPDDNSIRDAKMFGKRYGKAKERLTKIMQNIIRNNGVFIPPKYHKPAKAKTC